MLFNSKKCKLTVCLPTKTAFLEATKLVKAMIDANSDIITVL